MAGVRSVRYTCNRFVPLKKCGAFVCEYHTFDIPPGNTAQPNSNANIEEEVAAAMPVKSALQPIQLSSSIYLRLLFPLSCVAEHSISPFTPSVCTN